jgi:hypothetical protein
VIAVNPVEVSIVDIVDVIPMLDAFATASLSMLMIMVLMDITAIAHRVFPIRTIFCHMIIFFPQLRSQAVF